MGDCTLFPPGVPERGWVDSTGIPSPNGLLIAYVTNAVEDAKLVIESANDSSQVEVDAPNQDNPLWSRPRWSPDGQRIVFSNIVITAPGGGTFYSVNADGTDLRELATYTGYYDDFAWSADGQQIFFTSNAAQSDGTASPAASYQIYAVSTDGLGTPQPVAQGCGVLE
jgi:TolB protein